MNTHYKVLVYEAGWWNDYHYRSLKEAVDFIEGQLARHKPCRLFADGRLLEEYRP